MGGSLTIKSGAIVTFTGALGLGGTSKIIIEPGAKLVVVTGGLAIQATTSLVSQGSVAVRAGGFNIQGNATFTLSGINKDTIIGGAIFNGTSNIKIGVNSDLYIYGNITGQSATVKVDGSISVNGTIFIGWSLAAFYGGSRYNDNWIYVQYSKFRG